MRIITQLACFLALSSPISAQPDVRLLMERAVNASLGNNLKVRQYTWDRERAFWRLDKKGNKTNYTTQKWEATRIGDRTENKLIERNGRPLKNPKLKDESLDAGFRLNLSVDTAMVARLFDLRYLRAETFRGRKCWVVLATPKPEALPKDANDRELLNFHITLWLEQETIQNLRGLLEVATDKAQMDKGSTVEWISEPNEEGAWLVREQHLRYSVKNKTRGEWHETYTNFRKFEVNSRITVDPE